MAKVEVKEGPKAARIVQTWDGGERLTAVGMAREANDAERDAAVKERPDLGKYLNPDFNGKL